MSFGRLLSCLGLGLALSAIACQSGGSSSPKSAAGQPAAGEAGARPRLPPPAHLSETTRAMIAERMQSHADDMTFLLWAVLFLDYDGVQHISGMLEKEPRIARPLSSDDSTLNALLPPEFFVLQDDFVAKAKTLSTLASASNRNPVALAKAYGELTETCVRCHSVYLYDEPPTR